MRFSVVMPIHNEEKKLPFSLPSVFRLKPDEVILIFDRCNDNSQEIAKKLTSHFNYESRTKLIEMDEPTPEWHYRVAYLMRYGYKKSTNDIILTTAADIILDKKIKYYLNNIRKNNIKFVSFGLKHYPLNIQYFIRRLICLFFPRKGFSGVFFFSKSAWLETEKEESVKKVLKAQDTHLFLSIKKKYDTEHIWTDSIHLRAREDPSDHYWRGIAFYHVANKSLGEVIVSSLIYLRPMMILGYLHAKSKLGKK